MQSSTVDLILLKNRADYKRTSKLLVSHQKLRLTVLSLPLPLIKDSNPQEEKTPGLEKISH